MNMSGLNPGGTGSPEAKLVHGDGKVPGLVVAVVEVAVVHGDQVHVAEDEAVVLAVLQGLRVAHVQQLGAVERLLAQLPGDAEPRQTNSRRVR